MTKSEASKEKADLVRQGRWRGHKVIKIGDEYAIVYTPQHRRRK
jgi:hypothetical protein